MHPRFWTRAYVPHVSQSLSNTILDQSCNLVLTTLYRPHNSIDLSGVLGANRRALTWCTRDISPAWAQQGRRAITQNRGKTEALSVQTFSLLEGYNL